MKRNQWCNRMSITQHVIAQTFAMVCRFPWDLFSFFLLSCWFTNIRAAMWWIVAQLWKKPHREVPVPRFFPTFNLRKIHVESCHLNLLGVILWQNSGWSIHQNTFLVNPWLTAPKRYRWSFRFFFDGKWSANQNVTFGSGTCERKRKEIIDENYLRPPRASPFFKPQHKRNN